MWPGDRHICCQAGDNVWLYMCSPVALVSECIARPAKICSCICKHLCKQTTRSLAKLCSQSLAPNHSLYMTSFFQIEIAELMYLPPYTPQLNPVIMHMTCKVHSPVTSDIILEMLYPPNYAPNNQSETATFHCQQWNRTADITSRLVTASIAMQDAALYGMRSSDLLTQLHSNALGSL